MAKTMKLIAGASLVLLLLLALWYAAVPKAWILSALITIGTIAYHFWMRLFVGYTVDRVMKNRADYTKAWYRIRPWEERFYVSIGVKGWKNHLPTYDPAAFSPKEHTWDEIAQAMCQAELVHEIIAVLSFLPILTVPWLGAPFVFVCTSVLAALYDLQFVVLQRFNRPRILRMVEKQKRLKNE